MVRRSAAGFAGRIPHRAGSRYSIRPMARQRMIVGLGEVLLRESPEGSEAAGLAAEVALRAARLGQRGAVISRVGQDEPGNELLAILQDAGVETSHVQTDPDLPTGRVVVRAVGGSVARYVESRAAFDNLQWDFDLEDAAQQADAVIYGMLTRRSGQTRSEENRFLRACTAALKVFDGTHSGDQAVDRSHVRSGLEHADIALLDHASVAAVLPVRSDEAGPEEAAAVLRETGLSLVVLATGRGGRTAMSVHGGPRDGQIMIASDRASVVWALVALVLGIVQGRELTAALAFAQRVADFSRERPTEPVPPDWLEG